MKISAAIAIIPFLLAACGGGGGDVAPAGVALPSPSASLSEPAAHSSTQISAQIPAQSSAQTATQANTPAHPDGTVPQPVTAPVPQPAPGAPALVEYYGDSIIWGWMPNTDWGRVDQPAPAVFAADTGLAVQNMGSPGRMAEHALAGDGVYPAWSQQMAQSKATHVIIEYHSHDTVADTTTRVRELIRIAKASGKKVIVETVGPGNHSGELSYEQISQAQRDAAAAENVPVIDQTAHLNQYLASSGKSVWDIAADGLHPNPDIYVMKGHYAAREFAALK